MNDELRDKIFEVQRRHSEKARKEVNKVIDAFYRVKSPFVKKFFVGLKDNSRLICVDWQTPGGNYGSFEVEMKNQDCYSNTEYGFNRPDGNMPPMSIVTLIAAAVGDNWTSYVSPYRYRPVTQFLIAFWKRYSKKLDAKDLVRLLILSDELPCENKFSSYLLTDLYGSHVDKFSEFSEWPIYQKAGVRRDLGGRLGVQSQALCLRGRRRRPSSERRSDGVGRHGLDSPPYK